MIRMKKCRKVQLPSDFAQQILDCQIQIKLSEIPPPQILKKLIELYATGVEYYESIRSYKYLYFHKKMNQLLTESIPKQSQQLDQIHLDSPIQRKLKSTIQEQKIQAIKIKQKQKDLHNQVVQKTYQVHTGDNVKNIIQGAQSLKIKIQQKIKGQIQSQDQLLQQKLLRRKSKVIIARSLSMVQKIRDNETNQSIGNDNNMDSIKFLNPIKVSFKDVIDENQSDEDQQHLIRNKKDSFSNFRNKFKSQIQLNSKDSP